MRGYKLVCVMCGKPIKWLGKGRPPIYCKECRIAKKRISVLKSVRKLRKKIKKTKNDLFALKTQKRAS